MFDFFNILLSFKGDSSKNYCLAINALILSVIISFSALTVRRSRHRRRRKRHMRK